MATEKITAAFVSGKFVAKGSYVLLDAEGNIFFSVKSGDSFEAGGKTWNAKEVPDKKNPKKTVLKCETEDSFFFLTHNKVGHWDFNRPDVFISPRNPIEAFFMKRGIIRNTFVVKNEELLTAFVTTGGNAKVGRVVVNLLDVITDGDIEIVNQEIPFITKKITNATYVIETVRDAKGVLYPVKVVVKSADNYDKVIEALEKIGVKP